jgi:hypothetical protein
MLSLHDIIRGEFHNDISNIYNCFSTEVVLYFFTWKCQLRGNVNYKEI